MSEWDGEINSKDRDEKEEEEEKEEEKEIQDPKDMKSTDEKDNATEEVIEERSNYWKKRKRMQINTDETGSPGISDEEEQTMTLGEYASMSVTVFYPVLITMVLTVVAVRVLNMSQMSSNMSSLFAVAENSSSSTGMKLGGALLSAFAFMSMILLVTVVFVLLYKYRCMKIIFGWLILSTITLLGVFGGTLIMMTFEALNLTMDWLTFVVLLINFAVVGNMAIFYVAPPILNKTYLIIISFLMATFFTRLPEWTTWGILIVMALYDLCAVLTPSGPLKQLVDLAQERNEPIPALVYNASVVLPTLTNIDDMTEDEYIDANIEAIPLNPIRDEEGVEGIEHEKETKKENLVRKESDDTISDDDDGGIKLGLGDFVFYSVLVGRAAMYDMMTVFTAVLAIVAGLFGTLVLLAVSSRALPALPFSIALGAIFYFLTRLIITPFITTLSMQGISI